MGVEKRPCVGGCIASSFRSRFSIYSLFRTTSGEFYNNNKDGKLWANCRCVFKHGSVGKIDSQDVCNLRQALLSLKVNWLANSFRALPPWWSWIELKQNEGGKWWCAEIPWRQWKALIKIQHATSSTTNGRNKLANSNITVTEKVLMGAFSCHIHVFVSGMI